MTELQTADCVSLSTATLVGSRDFPAEKQTELAPHILRITNELIRRKVKGISGAAPGLDTVWFRAYCYLKAPELFIHVLPWPGFQEIYPESYDNVILLDDWMDKFAEHILGSAGVLWYYKLSYGIQKLYKRNVYQIVLPDYSMSDVVFYYCKTTKKGDPTGGTAIAVRLARAFGIPNFNIGIPSELEAAYKFLGLDYVPS